MNTEDYLFLFCCPIFFSYFVKLQKSKYIFSKFFIFSNIFKKWTFEHLILLITLSQTINQNVSAESGNLILVLIFCYIYLRIRLIFLELIQGKFKDTMREYNSLMTNLGRPSVKYNITEVIIQNQKHYEVITKYKISEKSKKVFMGPPRKNLLRERVNKGPRWYKKA